MHSYTVIVLGPRDARFHTLNYKNAHIFHAKCAIFAFDIFLVGKKSELRIEMAKIAHTIPKKCAIFHIIIFSDITIAYTLPM